MGFHHTRGTIAQAAPIDHCAQPTNCQRARFQLGGSIDLSVRQYCRRGAAKPYDQARFVDRVEPTFMNGKLKVFSIWLAHRFVRVNDSHLVPRIEQVCISTHRFVLQQQLSAQGRQLAIFQDTHDVEFGEYHHLITQDANCHVTPHRDDAGIGKFPSRGIPNPDIRLVGDIRREQNAVTKLGNVLGIQTESQIARSDGPNISGISARGVDLPNFARRQLDCERAVAAFRRRDLNDTITLGSESMRRVPNFVPLEVKTCIFPALSAKARMVEPLGRVA